MQQHPAGCCGRHAVPCCGTLGWLFDMTPWAQAMHASTATAHMHQHKGPWHGGCSLHAANSCVHIRCDDDDLTCCLFADSCSVPGPMLLVPLAAGADDSAGPVSMQNHAVSPCGVNKITKNRSKMKVQVAERNRAPNLS